MVTKRTTVEGLIGTTTDETKPGLYQKPNYTFHYSATTETVDPTTLITLKTPTATIGGGTTAVQGYDNGSGVATTTDANLDNMTADTMDNEEFADYNSDGVKWAVVTPTYGTVANNSALKTAFDNYVIALKKKALLDEKIKICDDAKALENGSTTSVARVTLADGNKMEVEEYKAILVAKRTALVNGDLATYEAEYNKQKKIVNDAISDMNDLQDEINLANEVDNGKVETIPNGLFDTNPTATYGGDKDAGNNNNDTYPTEASGGRRSVVNGTNGTTDTITEKILKKYLEDVYGVALKDQESDTTKKNNYYQQDATKSADGKARFDQPTYSPEVTKVAIDKSLDYDKSNGKIKWKDTLQAPLAEGDKTKVEASPYHDDKTVEFMKKFRDGKVTDAKAAYEAAVRAENGQGAVAEDGIVKIYVNLANVGNGETKEQWQYIADAATEEGKDFNFYYTSILPSGQTSSLLITSVEFDKDVKQHAFRDIQLDLDVTSESAQVVYNGDVIEATAANATITGAKTTAETYATVDGPVQWAADKSARSENITDKDPNPKADTTVTP